MNRIDTIDHDEQESPPRAGDIRLGTNVYMLCGACIPACDYAEREPGTGRCLVWVEYERNNNPRLPKGIALREQASRDAVGMGILPAEAKYQMGASDN